MDYDITSPDGRKFRVTAPDGATQEEVLAYAKANMPKAEPAPQPAQPTRQHLLEEVLNKRSWGSGISKLVYELGGKVTDATGSPALGAATQTVGELGPSLMTSGRVVGEAAPVLEKVAKTFMQSALKPSSKDILSGDAAKAVDTLLKENANISSAGAVKLRGRINQLESEAAKMVEEAAAGGAVVDKAYVMSEVAQELKKFRNQVNPGADTQAVLKSWEEFRQAIGAKIPVAEAHSLKKGTYGILADKYAKQGTVENVPGTQTQMAMARGLRKGTEEVVPGLGKVTSEESRIINALEMSEKRGGITGNKDIAGIAWLANNPAAAAAMMADRSAAFKSWLANRIYQVRNAAPSAVQGGTMYGATQANQQ